MMRDDVFGSGMRDNGGGGVLYGVYKLPDGSSFGGGVDKSSQAFVLPSANKAIFHSHGQCPFPSLSLPTLPMTSSLPRRFSRIPSLDRTMTFSSMYRRCRGSSQCRIAIFTRPVRSASAVIPPRGLPVRTAVMSICDSGGSCGLGQGLEMEMDLWVENLL